MRKGRDIKYLLIFKILGNALIGNLYLVAKREDGVITGDFNGGYEDICRLSIYIQNSIIYSQNSTSSSYCISIITS